MNLLKYNRGYVGIGVYNPKTKENLGTLVRSANCFGIDFAYSIGKRLNIRNTSLKHERHIPLFHFDTFNDFITSIPVNAELVCIEMKDNAQSLHTFVPSERTIYLLGQEDGTLNNEMLNHKRVKGIYYIPTNYCLNVAVAGSIVLYHDRMKRR